MSLNPTFKKKINILFISHDGGSGGAEKCLLDLTSRMDKNKFNIYVNIPHKGYLSEALESNRIPYFIAETALWLPSPRAWGARHLLNFFKTLRPRLWSIETKIQNLDIDLIYSNSITCIDGALAAYHMNIPHIWHLHENIQGNQGIKSYLPLGLSYYITQFFCKNFISVSSKVSSHLLSKKSSINIVHNGVNINKFSYHPNDCLRKELHIDNDTKIIAQIGSLIPAKGLSTFIQAAEILLSKHPAKKTIFLLIGSGPEDFTTTIKEQINRSTFKQYFFLLGQRNDISQIISNIDILLLCSESEGFPRVLIEAMTASKPVIATRCGGPEDIIIDGETGFLVPINNAHVISTKIKTLLDQPILAKKMGNNGLHRAMKLYSMEKYIKSIEQVIIKVINN